MDDFLDTRSVDDLINAALCESNDIEQWKLLHILRCRGSWQVFEAAAGLCRSGCSFERQLGVLVLSQLGQPERTFPRECSSVLNYLLKNDSEPAVLSAALQGLCDLNDQRPIELAIRFARHPHPDVRWAAVQVFSTQEDPVSVRQLIALSRDSNSDVRDWATFGLGTLSDVDSPEIRAAFVDRLNDDDDDTRAEAMLGLARRSDHRVIPALQRELSSDKVGSMILEAAEILGARELVPYLTALRPWPDQSDLLENAIAACEAGVGRGSAMIPASH